MSYTQVYRFQNLPGYESVISKGNSDMTYMGFARILLKAGEVWSTPSPVRSRRSCSSRVTFRCGLSMREDGD